MGNRQRRRQQMRARLLNQTPTNEPLADSKNGFRTIFLPFITSLLVSTLVATYGYHLAVKEKRIDQQSHLVRQVLELRGELQRRNARPGALAVLQLSPEQAKQPGIVLTAKEFYDIHNQLDELGVLLPLYFSETVYRDFLAISEALTVTHGLLDARPWEGPSDTVPGVELSTRYKTLEQTRDIQTQFGLLLQRMANELHSERLGGKSGEYVLIPGYEPPLEIDAEKLRIDAGKMPLPPAAGRR